MTIVPDIVWHDLECHGYEADLPLWLALAEREAGPVLDVGAGTGRVTLALAAAGHDVTALDRDAALLAELERRAAARGLRVRSECADAARFALGPFGLIVVPMQTVQLLGDRPAFWRAARAALAPGGLLAAAIADELVAFEDPDVLPEPDVGEWDGRRYVSQPVAVRVGASHARIERVRTIEGEPPTDDVIELAVVDPAQLAAEARVAGLHAVPGERIPPTGEHVGSSVVMFR
jgi:SAM-dependent methyltransferase